MASQPVAPFRGPSTFAAFYERIQRELLRHPIIVANPYTEWFRRGEQTSSQVRAFIVQFSVFSNQFLLAQLHKTLNADSLETMRASKEILANELGVIFNKSGAVGAAGRAGDDADPDLVSTSGSIEGGRFRFRAAHFEWLLNLAEHAELGFSDIGKRRHGSASTLHFCDALIRLYGSDDYTTAQASSFAVENWAAAGFWKELTEGLSRYNARSGTSLPLAFFKWHDRLEGQHAEHTIQELEEVYASRRIDEDAFITHGNEMLDAVRAFWDGLDSERKALEQ